MVKTYKLARVYSDTFYSADVSSTDPITLRQLRDDLVKILQRKVPKFKLNNNVLPLGELDGDGEHSFSVSNLEEKREAKATAVFVWIERWFCERGWEPFAVADNRVYFRQAIDL